ncbi:MAG: M56 family metallopeptidase [Bryobacteraceae bacterium]
MTDFLIGHLWQSTLFAGFAWALTMLLRRNGAHVRYWIWFAASLKFLIPFALLLRAGSLIQWHLAVPECQRNWIATAEQLGQPVLRFPTPATASPVARISNANGYIAAAVATLWFAGFLFVSALWLTRLARVRTLRFTAKAYSIGNCPIPILSTAGPSEPGVFGIRKPVLLLPAEIVSRLTEPQLRAIIAHELCHVRRRDNLTAAIHIGVQTIFWFHPLVWWIGTRLLEERELACDEAVLRIGEKPRDYAEGILNVCRLYVGSPIPFVAGVGGSDLRKRIEKIMRNRMPPGLSAAKKLIVGLSGVTVLALPIGFGLVDTTPRWSAFAQEPPRPSFEVASVKPTPASRRGFDFGTYFRSLPGGRFSAENVPLGMLVTKAYSVDSKQIVGGNSLRFGGETYEIEAKANNQDPRFKAAVAAGPAAQEALLDLMLQSLLADRFKLAVHREAKEASGYALIVAKGGPKLKEPAEGRDGDGSISVLGRGRLKAQKAPLSMLVGQLTRLMGRSVVDETGLAGGFDFDLEWTPEDTPTDLASAPSIFTALQEQLGLRLETRKEQTELIVIDHVEKPDAN